MRQLAAPVLALTIAVFGVGCSPAAEDGGSSGKGGGSASGGSGGSGGRTGSGGGTGGASSGSGGSTGTGGSSASGGSPGAGGSTSGAGGSSAGAGGSARGGTSGSGGGSAPDMGGSNDGPGFYFKSTCGYPVMSGYTPIEFCTAYAEVCTFTGTGRYKDMAECMTRFKGGASDADACKAGHLCRAYKLPAGKEKDCASAGTSACNKND